MEKYLVVIEKAGKNYSAFSPDVAGCAATGGTVEETTQQMKEALQFHIESLSDTGDNPPQPKGISGHIADGVFKIGEISEEYYITEIEISIPYHA